MKGREIDVEAKKENDKILRERRLKVIQILQEWIKNYWSEDFEYFDVHPKRALLQMHSSQHLVMPSKDLVNESKTNDDNSGGDNLFLMDDNDYKEREIKQSQKGLRQYSGVRDYLQESEQLRQEFLDLIREMKDKKHLKNAPYLASFSKLIQDKYNIVYKE